MFGAWTQRDIALDAALCLAPDRSAIATETLSVNLTNRPTFNKDAFAPGHMREPTDEDSGAGERPSMYHVKSGRRIPVHVMDTDSSMKLDIAAPRKPPGSA